MWAVEESLLVVVVVGGLKYPSCNPRRASISLYVAESLPTNRLTACSTATVSTALFEQWDMIDERLMEYHETTTSKHLLTQLMLHLEHEVNGKSKSGVDVVMTTRAPCWTFLSFGSPH